MMKEFKVYFDGRPATQDQLDTIEEIVVEQEIGRVWEARIRIPICINEDGSWCDEQDSDYAEHTRVRIEVRIGETGFIPLIDGRITGIDPGLSAYPGDSTLTLTVHDDSTLLHRMASSESFHGDSDSDIVRSIFTAASFQGEIDVEDTGSPVNPDMIVQRLGTPMQLLRSIMSRHRDFFAYVLPGAEPGSSDCCFRRLPETPDPDLPDLLLTGTENNINSFNIRRMSNRASVHEGATLNMSEMSITTARSSSTEVEPAEGEVATRAGDSDIQVRRLPPGIGDQTDLQESADGAARHSSFTLQADGAVLPLCYTGILSPYRMIRVRVSNSRYSGNYVIFKVTHTLGISEYTQAFSLRGNAVTPEVETNSGGPAAAAASAAASVDFNIQGSVF